MLMRPNLWRPSLVGTAVALIGLGAGLVDSGLVSSVRAQSASVLGGAAAFGSWHDDVPGKRRHITADALPAPYASPSVGNGVRVVRPPADAKLKVPAGFEVKMFASGLAAPRLLRAAPNGDIFVAETAAGRVRVLRPGENGATASQNEIFASGLRGPFGIAFYPADNPEWVYVGNTDSVVRFAYRDGDMKARGAPETIVAQLPTGGHSTRDVVFSKDGSKMFVSVGSASNDAEGMGRLDPAGMRKWEQDKPAGAGWGNETERAGVNRADLRAESFRDHLGRQVRGRGSLDEELVLGEAFVVDIGHRDGGGIGPDARQLEARAIGHQQVGEPASENVIR